MSAEGGAAYSPLQQYRHMIETAVESKSAEVLQLLDRQLSLCCVMLTACGRTCRLIPASRPSAASLQEHSSTAGQGR